MGVEHIVHVVGVALLCVSAVLFRGDELVLHQSFVVLVVFVDFLFHGLFLLVHRGTSTDGGSQGRMCDVLHDPTPTVFEKNRCFIGHCSLFQNKTNQKKKEPLFFSKKEIIVSEKKIFPSENISNEFLSVL